MKTAFLPPRRAPQKREFKTRTKVHKMWAAATELTEEVRRGRWRGLSQAVVDPGDSWGSGKGAWSSFGYFGPLTRLEEVGTRRTTLAVRAERQGHAYYSILGGATFHGPSLPRGVQRVEAI
jgi:hypothetical protein